MNTNKSCVVLFPAAVHAKCIKTSMREVCQTSSLLALRNPHLSKHSSVWVFFTVPKALVVSGDSTSSAGFSSGTSGLGYLHATTSFQRQNSNQSLFKIFQSILEHLPARKRSFINIKYIYNKYINMDFCGFYTNSTRLFAGFSLQKCKTKFLHLSRLEPALSNMSR